MDDDPRMDLAREGTLRRYIQDLAQRIGSAALLIGSAIVFIAAAIGGIAMIGRLGGAGWLIYVVVMSTFALVFGPIVASAYTLRKEGSKKYRDERRRRIEEQRRKFGLHLRAQEGAEGMDPGARPPAPSADPHRNE